MWRLGQLKDAGKIDLNWDEIANILNREFRTDETEYRESSYRKPYTQAKRFYEAGVFNNLSEDKYLKELQTLKEEIYKEKRKLYDQRRERNKDLISEARAEHLSDELVAAANRLSEIIPLTFDESVYDCDVNKEALITFADWHYGMVTDNIWNSYNTEICRERVEKFVTLAKEFIWQNDIGTIHLVLLGDACNGSIHTTCRVQSEENTCDQLMNVSELMAQAINSLSEIVNRVEVYSCYGNHLRTIQRKEDSIHSDNMEKIIPWWLKQRLQNNKKIHIIESEYKEFTKLNILGKNIVCVHGDLENFKNIGTVVNTIFSKKYGETIDYTVSADKHHLEEFEQFDIESILIRSLCGTDDHASSKRLYSKPGQTLMIFNNVYGREATYHIPLN